MTIETPALLEQLLGIPTPGFKKVRVSNFD
jgi:hypothetical protein